MKGPDSAPVAPPSGGQKLLDRLNEYGERHATAIISISTGLIILTVLIFAKYFYDKAQVERAEQELSQADSIEQLTGLKTKYGATPVAPRIVFRLAGKYYDEGKLDQARNEYKEFQSRFPEDRLFAFATRALNSLDRNLKFDAEGKEARLKEYRLLGHPRQITDAKDPRYQWGPLPPARPVVELELAGATVKAELFEDEAPNAVAAFVKLAEQKAFDGAKWDLIADERIQAQAKAEGGADYTIAIEDSKMPADAYTLVLGVSKEGGVSSAQFQILLRTLPALKDVTVFGRITDGIPALKAVKKDEAIKSVKVASKREHVYDPQTLKK